MVGRSTRMTGFSRSTKHSWDNDTHTRDEVCEKLRRHGVLVLFRDDDDDEDGDDDDEWTI